MYLYALVWLVVLPIRLWWIWVLLPSWNWALRLLQPRLLGATDPLSRRLNLTRTILVAVGASLAELQWRWGTDEFGDSLWGWLSGFFTGPLALAVAVLVFAVVFPLCARPGDRLPMLKRMLIPVLVIVGAAAVLASLPLVVAAFDWLQTSRKDAMSWASDGLYGALLVLAGIVLAAVLLYFPPLVVLGAWLGARGSFRAGDAHPLMPAAASILAGTLLAAGPLIETLSGAQLESGFPPWAAIALAVVIPGVTVVLAVVELLRLIIVGGWSWRSLYVPLPTS